MKSENIQRKLSKAQLETLEKNSFKKGVSGNPKGRPKKRRDFHTIVNIAYDLVRKEFKKKGHEISDIEAEILKVLLIKAIAGSSKHLELFLDRNFGKVKQDIGLSGEVETSNNEVMEMVGFMKNLLENDTVKNTKTSSKRGSTKKS